MALIDEHVVPMVVEMTTAAPQALRQKQFFNALMAGDSIKRACHIAGLDYYQVCEIALADSARVSEVERNEGESGRLWRSQFRDRTQEILHSWGRVLAQVSAVKEMAESLDGSDYKASAARMKWSLEAAKLNFHVILAQSGGAKKSDEAAAARAAYEEAVKKASGGKGLKPAIDIVPGNEYTTASLKSESMEAKHGGSKTQRRH